MRRARRHPAGAALVAAALAWTFAAPARAGTPADSPDDICAPTDDPCLISAAYDVTFENPLDFGLRTVRVVPGGRLDGEVNLSCGAFEVAVAPQTNWMAVTGPPSMPHSAVFTARRACSGDASTPCLTDTTCAGLSLGTCSVGDGGIRIVGAMGGSDGPDVGLRAAGDITIDGEIRANAAPSGGFAQIEIESSQGSIESDAVLDVSGGGLDESYDPPFPAGGGAIVIRAARDVRIRDLLLATGGGAEVGIDAGEDLFLDSGILAQGVPGSPSIGGTVDLSAGGDLSIVDGPGVGRTTIDTTGGHIRYSYGSGAIVAAGPGGYGFIDAGDDITFGERVLFKGNSGMSFGLADDLPFATDWYVEAQGDLAVHSGITSQGLGKHGYGRLVKLQAHGAVTLGRRALVTTESVHGGNIQIYGGSGPISLDGRLTARSRAQRSYGEWHGSGGSIAVVGGDVTMRGRAQTGGGSSYGTSVFFSVCRLRLKQGAMIEAGRRPRQDYSGYNILDIQESMVAEPGSRIFARPNGETTINFRDPAKPPVLAGVVDPAPTLNVEPLFAGCPVCGNGEVDAGETCDDGNTVPGDGCSDLCAVE